MSRNQITGKHGQYAHAFLKVEKAPRPAMLFPEGSIIPVK